MDVPDPDDIVSFPTDDRAKQMPESTRRAFEAHSDAGLSAESRVEQATREIERVFEASPDAAVAVSGGKDSMAVLALAAAADCDHRAFHWDWGPRLIPRDVELELVQNIQTLVPDERFYVAARESPEVKAYPNATGFKRLLSADGGITTPDGSLSRLAGVLGETDLVTRQIVALRRGESSKRARKLDGLYGESLGQPAAFPLREWSGRDVWAYIVKNDVPYPDHYDRLACEANDGSPEAYEEARFTTFFDPEFENISAGELGVAAWDQRDVTK